MGLGRHLRELWENRLGFAACVALAALAALWSIAEISLTPPGIEPRVVEIASASTRAVVDSPTSAVLDLDIPTTNLEGMTNRGVLVGNMIASEPVRGYVARRADVKPELLQVASPVTPDFPRPLATSGKRTTKDILKSPKEYRLSIQANPTVPILDIYAEAPTVEAARALANGAVDGMSDYLRDLAAEQDIPAARRVHIEQLGTAHGGLINDGVSVKLAALSFVLTFALAAGTVLALTRVRRGWRVESFLRGGLGPQQR
jgi:hypothetical protein